MDGEIFVNLMERKSNQTILQLGLDLLLILVS